jgi:hypothetical protein
VRQHGGLIVCDGRVPTVHKDATYGYEYDGHSVPDAEGYPAEAIGA